MKRKYTKPETFSQEFYLRSNVLTVSNPDNTDGMQNMDSHPYTW